MAYVTGLAEHVLVRYHNVYILVDWPCNIDLVCHLRDDPLTFKVPLGVYCDCELQLKLSTLVKELLTNIKSQFKVKVTNMSYHIC